MKATTIYRLFILTAVIVAVLFAGAVVLASNLDSGMLYPGVATTDVPYVGFTAVGTYFLGFGSAGAFPGGVHATAPPYSVNATVPDWVSVSPISGNFSTTVSPYGPLADVLTAAAVAGNTPSQFLFTLLSAIIVLAGSLLISWFWRMHGSNGTLFAKGSVCLVIMGIFVALRWNDFWMILFFVIFFAAFGMMSRHQSWQS